MIQSKRYDNEQIRRFLYFLKTFIYIENLEITIKFDNKINSLPGNEKAMGIIETLKLITREEGMEQGQHKIIKNLLQNSDFNIAKIAMLAGVPTTYVVDVKNELDKGL